MPLYIVRWPELSFSLVRAHDEIHLIDILDEVADPGSCRWAVYKGPLFLDFELPVSYDLIHENEQGGPMEKGPIKDIKLKRVPPMERYPEFKLTGHGEETYYAMVRKIIKFAFPHLSEFLANSEDELEDGPVDPKGLRAALLKELEELKASSEKWSELQGRTDPEAILMQNLGVTRNPYAVPGTQVLYYHREREGEFHQIEEREFSAVLKGTRALPPDADGAIRYAEVVVIPQSRDGDEQQLGVEMIFTKLPMKNGLVDQEERSRLIQARRMAMSAVVMRQLAPEESKKTRGAKEPPPGGHLDDRWSWQPTSTERKVLLDQLCQDIGCSVGPTKLYN